VSPIVSKKGYLNILDQKTKVIMIWKSSFNNGLVEMNRKYTNFYKQLKTILSLLKKKKKMFGNVFLVCFKRSLYYTALFLLKVYWFDFSAFKLSCPCNN
jgi:hypothetical protein